MTGRSPAATGERFFQSHIRAWLILPDGWYGRPFDSLFSLVLSSQDNNGLLVEIEGGRKLTFTGGSIAAVKTRFEKYQALKIEGFDHVVWDPHEGVSQKTEYSSGQVTFASPGPLRSFR